jgi:hypothetical protein
MINDLSKRCLEMANELRGQPGVVTRKQRMQIEALLTRAGNRIATLERQRARWLDETLPKTKGPNRGTN